MVESITHGLCQDKTKPRMKTRDLRRMVTEQVIYFFKNYLIENYCSISKQSVASK